MSLAILSKCLDELPIFSLLAKNTQPFVTDDLDGSSDASESSFSYKGTEYLDLAEKNEARLEKALLPFIGKATKVGASKKAPTSGRRTDLHDIRVRAQRNGHQVKERGRLPGVVIEAYDSSH